MFDFRQTQNDFFYQPGGSTCVRATRTYFKKKINLVGTGMGSQEDIWIFKIEFARLMSFDPQFASLSKYNPLLANCFTLPIFSLFLDFSLLFSVFSL